MKEVQFALKKIPPVVFAYVFVGLAFGVLMLDAGFSLPWVLCASLFIYAGSMQILMVPLLTAGTSLPVMGLMAFFINARHIFYGIGFLEEFRQVKQERFGLGKYLYMALTVTDETYTLLCSLEIPSDLDRHRVQRLVLFFCHMTWVLSTVAGAVAGQLLPFDMTGIDFSATIFFTVVVINQWQQFPSKLPALTGLVTGALCLLILGPDRFILPALSASLVVLALLRDRVRLAQNKARQEAEQVLEEVEKTPSLAAEGGARHE